MLCKLTSVLRISIGEAAINALLGYAVVFVGLVLLMLLVILLGRVMMATQKKAAAAETPAAPAAAAPAAAAPAPAEPAKGTGGQILLNNVPEKDAALVMAVVAYQLGKPLNRLRFQSIKEVTHDEV